MFVSSAGKLGGGSVLGIWGGAMLLVRTGRVGVRGRGGDSYIGEASRAVGVISGHVGPRIRLVTSVRDIRQGNGGPVLRFIGLSYGTRIESSGCETGTRAAGMSATAR